MAGEGSSGFTSHNPHGHCTSVQTHLLWLCCAHTVLLHRTAAGTQPSPGSSTHSAMFNLLQPFIIPKMCLSAHKNAEMFIPLPSASDCHHKMGHAATTEAWAQQHWGLVLLPAEQKIVSQLEVPILSHTKRLSLPEHQECVPCLSEQPGSTTRSGITRQEIAQQYRWCNSHTAWGFGSEIWAILTGERRQIKELIGAKTNLFSPTRLILTWIHLWIRFAVRLHKHFCWHRGSSRKEQAPGSDRKGNKGFWQDCWLLTTRRAHGTIM